MVKKRPSGDLLPPPPPKRQPSRDEFEDEEDDFDRDFGPPGPLPIARRPMPAPPKRGPMPHPMHGKKPYSAFDEMEKGVPQKKSTPPLFIKLDKYKELVKEIQTLKTYALSIRDALDSLGDLERELQEGLAVTNRALDTFTIIISSIDEKLIKTEEMTRGLRDAPPEVENYIRSVHDQIEKIRSDLRAISR